MQVLLATLLLAAPARASPPTAGQCDQLWDDTVAAAAPDLDPGDDLHKSYLSREKAVLLSKCRAASPAVLQCPAQATRQCAKKFPQPPDGGRALGLATCVWPEVQACAQVQYLRGMQPAVAAVLADVESGKLAAQKGLLQLTGERALLSLRGQALAEKRGDGWWLLLVTRRAGARVDGLLVRSARAEALPAGELSLAGLKLHVVRASPDGAEVSTQPR